MIKETSSTFIFRVLLVGLGAVNSVILARFLGPAGQGTFAVIATLITILSIIGGLGIGSANIYFLGQKRYELRILFWNSILTSAVVGVILIGIAYGLYEAIPSIFQGVGKDLVVLYALILPLLLGWAYISSFLLGFQRFTAFNIFYIVLSLFTLVNYLVFLSLSPTVRTAIIISIVLNGLGIILLAIYIVKRIDSSILRPKVNLRALSESIAFGVKGQLGNIAQFMNYRLDRLFVNWFAGPAAVGLYSVAVVLVESLWYVSNSIALVLFPKISASGDMVSNAQTTAKSCRISFFSALLMAGILVVIGPWLIPLLFGKAFADSLPALNYLLPGVVVFSLTNIIASYIIGRGFPHYNTIIALVSFVFTVVFDLLLIPRWGIIGAAIASSISYLVATITAVYYYRKIARRDSQQSGQSISVSLTDLVIINQRDWQSVRNVLRQFGI